ncbi:ATP12 family chaperone protein [Nioella nitratireducens]|uniref:ATP12 family chaperone protein n=1 Tax=Nioella nitratireducens TaxID=1287720 RepID=UPI0008FD6DA2|nr:ATP12 family protein [Nioella nitratireducens]
MSEWKAKRFWSDATVGAEADGFAVLLDGRPVRTPLKAPLTLPTRDMAEAVAAEWAAQDKVIDPLSMPVTRSANAALDKVMVQKAEVAAMLAAYAETDLLCHRAESPAELVAQQNKAWNPVLDWAASRYDAPLKVVSGILPATHSDASLARFREEVARFRPFSLTALHDLVTLSGSLVLGLYAASGEGDPETTWHLSRIDEDWQVSQWGEDEEATEYAEKKRDAFLHAARFLTLAQGS